MKTIRILPECLCHPSTAILTKKWLLFALTIYVCSAAQAFDSDRIKARFGIAVSPSTLVVEGDIVQFTLTNLEYFDPVTGDTYDFEADPSKVLWEFGDSLSASASEYGLYTIRHRFAADSGEGFFEVKVSHQGRSMTAGIQVKNAPPRSRVSATQNPRGLASQSFFEL
jgi:hypothetical protein